MSELFVCAAWPYSVAYDFARSSTPSVRSQRARLRTGFWSRRTVSRLWLRMSGPASMTARRGASAPLKSGISTSTPMPGHSVAQLADGRGEGPGAAVGQVVAGDRGDHDVLEAHLRHGFGDPTRLVVVEPGRATGLDRTEAAGPGAGVAQDHHRGGALVPAVPDVGAAGLLAHGVEVQATQQALEVVVVVARRHPRLDPVGMAAERDRAVGGRAERAAAHRDRDVARARRMVAPRRFEHRELASHGSSVGQAFATVSRMAVAASRGA